MPPPTLKRRLDPNGVVVADILVDTDVFIAHLRGRRRLEVPRRKFIWYSVITRCELLSGKGAEEAVIQQLLAPFQEVPVDRVVAERAGRLRRHQDLMTPDALIAATALEHGLILWTQNVRHFRSVPGLRVEAPKRAKPH
jgi:predicted nucleic acid-binding protein